MPPSPPFAASVYMPSFSHYLRIRKHERSLTNRYTTSYCDFTRSPFLRTDIRLDFARDWEILFYHICGDVIFNSKFQNRFPRYLHIAGINLKYLFNLIFVSTVSSVLRRLRQFLEPWKSKKTWKITFPTSPQAGGTQDGKKYTQFDGQVSRFVAEFGSESPGENRITC